MRVFPLNDKYNCVFADLEILVTMEGFPALQPALAQPTMDPKKATQ